MVFDEWRGDSPRKTNVAGRLETKMDGRTTMDTSFEQAGTRGYRVKTAAWWELAARRGRHPAGRIAISLIIVPAMAAFIAAASWLVWTLTYDALGRQAASLAVVALLGGTFAISREIARRA
jgi:hypothetical protein